MVDDTKNIADFQAAAEAAGIHGQALADIMIKVKDNLSGAAGGAKEAAKQLNTFSGINSLATESSKILGNTAGDVIDMFAKLTNATKDQISALSMLVPAVLGPSKLLADIGKNTQMTSFSEQLNDIIGDVKEATGPIVGLAAAFGMGDISGKSGTALAEIVAKIKNVGAAIEQHINMERAVRNFAVSTGQMNAMSSSMGVGLSQLSNVAKDYENHLSLISSATHISDQAAGEFFTSFSKLPPIFGDTSEGASRMSNQMQQLQQTITLAHGSGQQFDQALEQRRKLLENFNVTAENAGDITLRGAELTKTFGINIGDTTQFISDMIGPFEMLGNQTESMSGIFKEFFQGLRDGGLGIKPAIETIESMGKSMANMSVAQRAFLSARTGGPGGLLGGLEMQREIMAGGDRAKKVMDNMVKSFTAFAGGKITNLDQVHDQTTAAQYQKQVSALMSGTFGIKAGSEGQAAAMLKTMSAPGKGGSEDRAELLSEITKQGTDYEKISQSPLETISKKLDLLKALGGGNLSDIAQKTLTELTTNPDVKMKLQKEQAREERLLKRPGGGGNNMAGEYSEEATQSFGQAGLTLGPLLSSLGANTAHAMGIESSESKSIKARVMEKDKTDRINMMNEISAAKKSNLGPLHQNAPGAQTNRQGTAAGVKGGTDANMLNATINVFIDGKKVHQDTTQAQVISSYSPNVR